MLDTDFDELLKKKWSENEYNMILRLKNNLKFYKKILPKTLKNDISFALKLCIQTKDELEKLKCEKDNVNSDDNVNSVSEEEN